MQPSMPLPFNFELSDEELAGANTQQTYSEYIFAASNDRERLALQHQVFKPGFIQMIDRVLDEYGLAERLQQAVAGKAPRVQILDVGCGEGLLLWEVAAILEKRGLLSGAELSGFDIDRAAVATAASFSQLSKPSRPYLNFYVYDVTRPLQDNPDWQREGKQKFDFIYASVVMQHLGNARWNLENLYNSLNPGGVIYLRDVGQAPAEDDPEIGWVMPHPAMISYIQMGAKFVQAKNPGPEVPRRQPQWLAEFGATDIQTELIQIPAGGFTLQGKMMLRNILMSIPNMGRAFIANGLMTQEQIDASLRQMQAELTPDMQGHMTLVNTLARRPG